MKSFLLSMIFLLLAATLASSAPPAARFPEEVSLLQLIATPEKYNGKNISVVGFLRVEFEGNALYLHQEDYEQRIHKNSVWLGFEPKAIEEAKSLSMHYVFLVGTFDSVDKGHRAMFSGSIKQIGDLMIWPPSTEAPK
jgi:hypothetical protein